MSQRTEKAKHHYHQDLEQARVPRITSDLFSALGPVVYAVQTKDGHIKIGSTKDLAHRCGQVGYGLKSIIGFTPGVLSDELAIHKSLDGLAAHGREWYPWHPRVLAVVNEMRAHWGIEPITEPR